MQTKIDAHIVHPKGEHKSSIIWLHGLGADGHDFAPIAPELELDEHGVKFVFPHAPVRPITINNGFSMRGWYDIVTLDRSSFVHDLVGIRESTAYVFELIEAEMKAGVLPQNIILAGFSQGGAIALFAGLSAPVKLAGILALSTYLPAGEVVMSEKRDDTPPILMIHGLNDMVILPEYAEISKTALINMGCEVDFKMYAMGHTVCNEEIAEISKWFKWKLGSNTL